jgi:transcriptional regulator
METRGKADRRSPLIRVARLRWRQCTDRLDAGDILQGTLDMLILRIPVLGPAHGHTIAQAIERTSENALEVEQGSLYPAMHRLEDRGLVSSESGVSESNRKAKFYPLTVKSEKN